MKKAKFEIGNKFLVDVRVDRLFTKIIAQGKKRLVGRVEYTGVSNMFNNIREETAIIGLNGGFKAFNPDDDMVGFIDLSKPESDFNSLSEKPNSTEIINADDKTFSKNLPNLVSLVTFNYRKLKSFCYKHDFVAKEWGGMSRKNLIKFCKAKNIKIVDGKLKMIEIPKIPETKEELSYSDPGGENIASPKDESDLVGGLRIYEVVVEGKVANASGFLEIGAIINETQNFANPISFMEKKKWIVKKDD